MARPRNPERDRKVRELLVEGHNYTAIARMLDCSRKAVRGAALPGPPSKGSEGLDPRCWPAHHRRA